MAKNSNLHKARSAKNDEFYTKLTDVAREMVHYRQHFRGKSVLCNCDDPTCSAFWEYFHLNFSELGLRKLVSTHYHRTEPTYRMIYEGGDDSDTEAGERVPLAGNGDFRNAECIELLKEADIVCTNPPFSLFREYVAQLVEYSKKFAIIGNMNAINYKEFFYILRDGKVWRGNNSVHEFMHPDGTLKSFGNICWYTNLDFKKRHEELILWKSYSPEDYPNYDNYEGINVNKVTEIPMDYYGIMGVPITYLDKHNPDQFEILGTTCRGYSPEYCTKIYSPAEYSNANDLNGSPCVVEDGKPKMLYSRLLIRRRKETQDG